MKNAAHPLTILYHGFFFRGSTGTHRLDAFARMPGVQVLANEAAGSNGPAGGLIQRLRWKARIPADLANENGRLLAAAEAARPDVVLVDNSKMISRATLRRLRKIGPATLAFYSPDDIIAPHNLSLAARRTFPSWDLFFTTKTFNVPELASRGVKRPILIGNSFDPQEHQPLDPAQVGPDFESYDVVFIGTYEQSRARSLVTLAAAGVRVLIYGADSGLLGKWRSVSHPNLVVRPPAFGTAYARCLHHGKLALCFLRKANRDQITTRSIEIPAAGRAMVAEKTAEHDAHFLDGAEYAGFRTDAELIDVVRRLLANNDARQAMATAGRQRCLDSGYSTDARARVMVAEMQRVRSGRDAVTASIS